MRSLCVLALLLAGCSAMKGRYRAENRLYFQSAVCLPAFTTSANLKEMKAAKRTEVKDAENLSFTGLDESEATLSYCGPYCESRVKEKYRVGTRLGERELYLAKVEGDEAILLDFKNRAYTRWTFSSSGQVNLENGNCEFTPL